MRTPAAIGNILTSDLGLIAIIVRQRACNATRAPVLVYVIDDRIYAPRQESRAAVALERDTRLYRRAVVGVFTFICPRGDIEAALIEYRRERRAAA